MIKVPGKVLTEKDLDSFIAILTEHTGIVPRAGHREGIKNFIERKLDESHLSKEEYKRKLSTDKLLISEFVNKSTVNETYFFREEKHFAVLRDKIFPQMAMNNQDKKVKILSAACSYGEEAYSLSVMASLCGLKPEVTASDINSAVMEHCKNGLFLGTSLRSVDGVRFHTLVLPYRREDGRVAFPESIRKTVNTINLNLCELDLLSNAELLPKEQNLIFIRNVFIYFSFELRAKILKTIAEKCLAEDGYLFVSMNEIAQLDFDLVPDSLVKESEGNVFYFHKKSVKKGGKANG